MSKKINITNQRFGRTVAIKDLGKKWECQCDCGNKFITTGGNLRWGSVKSCGCLKREILQKGGPKGKQRSTWKGYGDISRHIFTAWERRAKSKGILFNITIEQIWDLFLKQNQKCMFSGEILQFNTSIKKNNGTASLDRIDSTKGYTIDNVQWVHKDLNYMKRTLNESVFFNWIKKIYEYKSLQNNV